MTDHPPRLVPMRVAELGRTAPTESGVERYIASLEDDAPTG